MTLVHRTDVNLVASSDRVMCRIFIPGDEQHLPGVSRVESVLERIARLTDKQVEESLARTMDRFDGRHRHLNRELETHFEAVSHLIPNAGELGHARRSLIGAYFTQEYAFESTAYFNPSIVPHPDQSGVPTGSLRFVMSVRAVGEGHISSMVFRTGLISADGDIVIDPVTKFATTRAHRYTALTSRLVRRAAAERGLDSPELQSVLGILPDTFTPEELEVSLELMSNERIGAAALPSMVHELRDIAQSSYEVDFDESTDISERVMWPTVSHERHGMEDARWVQFTEADGTKNYRATYAGYDGAQVVMRGLETTDFRCFSSMQLTGRAVSSKGLALFPRKVNGRYAAVSRWDRETNSIAFSGDGYHWDEAETFQIGTEPWEVVHLGNCGSPIETPEGWIVLTHGVGPIREYFIGAVLLDLEDPTKLISALPNPLLAASETERNGYVPNVVYSCGSLRHDGVLVIPYGIADCMTGIATVQVDELLEEFRQHRHRRSSDSRGRRMDVAS
ncbi:MAG: hypothetical protein F2793_09195 [Actinobacteria bacterium]|uniref:Unannotated protein n=1 Tax=freshwater metagenome TaxID=449393 RepID=A0A6J7EW32_9ZZZZ|nr:hypothetical protein [Actinomycetota bacterium]